ncbi:MAG: hypothetical protein R2690_20115 [Acidimicrobiales bacterium]
MLGGVFVRRATESVGGPATPWVTDTIQVRGFDHWMKARASGAGSDGGANSHSEQYR